MSSREPAWRSRLKTATLVTREWTADRGLIEHEQGFADLGELLDALIATSATLPERITLTGTDGNGREHAASFSFAFLRRGV